ncbi:tryptophan 2-C-methyltransferase [[Actinomadura] parvosata]|uniref:tryptophan 2-C-methyltransferase n=1 Tax=[Actinomadura] parvosata TaxID=1955412 RepID=UPI00406CAD6D
MSQELVVLVNPNKLHPPITPYALDILTTSLEAAGFRVEVLDLTFRRDDWRSAVEEFFADREPLLVGITIRNTDTIYPQEQRVFLPEHREIVQAIQAVSSAPIIAGGVGFSSMPFALVDYFGIDFGVKGPGEIIISRLAKALAGGVSPRTVPGLIINTGDGVTRVPGDGVWVSELPLRHELEGRAEFANRETAYTRRSGEPWKVDNLKYYQRGGLGNILTKNGCPFACTHCVEPDAKGNRFARRQPEKVVDEMEALTGQGVLDLHTTDSEFNLNIGNSKAILREIVRRKNADASSPLHRLRLWIYSQPAPFDEEFAELLAQAGCRGVNVAPDHVREDILKGWKVTSGGARYYTFDNTREVCRLANKYGMLTMVEVMAGMPGETWETLRECVDAMLALDATVVGFTLGIRLFPYSPLGIEFARRSAGVHTVAGVQSNTATRPITIRPIESCASVVEYERQFMFDEDGELRPLYYFSPDLPEDKETMSLPNGRWLRTVEMLWKYIPEEDHPRVMLPTAPGLTKDDNNYADNPFLTCLVQMGYKGAFWSHWRQRDEILLEAAARGLTAEVVG